MDRKKIAAAVVLFNPNSDVVANIESFRDQVVKIFVVDNSDTANNAIVMKIRQLDPKIIYVHNGGNQGIAHALNRAAMIAENDGFEFLLTMDQDTRLDDKFIDRLFSAVDPSDLYKIGIICPAYEKTSSKVGIENILFTMTSGNILNLKAFRQVGPFLNELFIDHVDHEFCLRLNANGYKVVQVNTVKIQHKPGHQVTVTMLGKQFTFSAHSPLRLYYFSRNGFYVSRLYKHIFPSYGRTFRWAIAKEIFKIFLLKGKGRYFKMIMRSYKDYQATRMGKYHADH